MSKSFHYLLTAAIILLLISCASVPGGGSSVAVGPAVGGSAKKINSADLPAPYLLEMVIPVLDPGLPEDEYAATKEGIWPELRRAEATRIAWKLKLAADKRQSFSAVRVTPTATASADLYLLGEILASNGEDLTLEIKLIDASGKTWYTENYTQRTEGYWYENPRNAGQDPFAPLYVEVIDDVIAYLKKKKPDDIARIQEISRLRFAQNFAPEAFNNYLQVKRGQVDLLSAPAADDPMVMRTDAIRVRDQLFIESFQDHYASFSNQMDAPYYLWQKDSGIQAAAARKAKTDAIWKTSLGVLVAVAGVAAIANAPKDDYGNSNAGNVIGGGAAVIGGAVLAGSGISSMKAAKNHNQALSELGKSISADVTPRVIEMENTTTTLTGTAEEQFTQWRGVLGQIYEAESTPQGDISIVKSCGAANGGKC